MTDGRLDAAILRQLLIALAMIIIMLWRPRGLWPAPEHGKVLPSSGDKPMSTAGVAQVQGISKRFGGLQALSDVGMTIQAGQVYGLIGPNGAGKTTFFNVITGLYTPDSGSFVLAARLINRRRVHEVAQAGIARTFQNIRLFAETTALENVMVGRHVRTGLGSAGCHLSFRQFVQEEIDIALRAQELLDYVGIGHLGDVQSTHARAMVINAVWRLPAPWPPTLSLSLWMNRRQV
jgi:ABC-type glutathione transport system ATPase component